MSWSEAVLGAAWCVDHPVAVRDTSGSSLHCSAASGGPWSTPVLSCSHRHAMCTPHLSLAAAGQEPHFGQSAGEGRAWSRFWILIEHLSGVKGWTGSGPAHCCRPGWGSPIKSRSRPLSQPFLLSRMGAVGVSQVAVCVTFPGLC